MNVFRRGHGRIGSFDTDGNVYQRGVLARKVGSVDRNGNVYRWGYLGRSRRVGSVDGDGNLYLRRGFFGRGRRVGSVDHGDVYRRGFFGRGRRIGRLRPMPTNNVHRIYAFGAALLLLLLDVDS
jgi:YD repeat-containing protein